MEESFTYLPQWRVLLCPECGFCLQPHEGAWKRHLRGKPHQIFGKQLAGLLRLLRSYDLVAPERAIRPKTVIPIINGLRRHKGFQCLSCFQFLTTSLVTMKRHVSKDHGFKTKQHGARPLWKACLLQTFFAENRHINYFVVHDSCEAEKPSGDPRFALSSMAEEVEQQLTRKIQELEESEAGLNSRGHRTQVSPWLEMTRWSVYLCGQDLRVAARLVELPDPNTDDGCLLAVVAAFDRVIEQARNSILEDRVSVFDQHRINSFIRGRTAARPIVSKLRDGTYKKYKEVWKRLLCFVYRMICKNQQPSLHCVITNAQSRALDEMINAARAAHAARAESNFNTERERSSIGGLQPVPQDVLDLRCLEFSVSLLDHCLKGNIYDSVVVGFLAVLGINVKELGFYDAGRYTSHLSALIKMAQMLVVQRAVAAADMGEVDYPADLLEEMQDRFMVYGSRSPINWAQKLRTYGSKIRDTTTSLGRIDWSEDGQRLRYKELELDMEGLRRLVRTETELAQEQLAGLLLIRPDESREDIVPALCLRRLRDDPTIQQKGWSFIDDKRNAELHGYERWLLRRVLECEWLQEEFLARPKWMKPSRSSMVAAKWKAQAVEHYLAQVDTFLERLLLLVHITGGQPARGTELLSLQWCNTVHGLRRNVFIEDGLVSFVTFYHKGYSVTNSTKIIHRYLPREIGELLVYYIWLVLPFCGQLKMLAFDAKEKTSQFLWSKGKEPWDSGRLSGVLTREFRTHLGTHVNIPLWRHAAIAISRRHSKGRCFKRDYDAQEVQSRADAQAGHNSTHAGLIYARGIEEAPGHVASARSEYRALSRDWHLYLGFSVYLTSRPKPLDGLPALWQDCSHASMGGAGNTGEKGRKRFSSAELDKEMNTGNIVGTKKMRI